MKDFCFRCSITSIKGFHWFCFSPPCFSAVISTYKHITLQLLRSILHPLMICCFLGIQELNKIIGKLMAQGVPPFLVPFRNPFNLKNLDEETIKITFRKPGETPPTTNMEPEHHPRLEQRSKPCWHSMKSWLFFWGSLWWLITIPMFNWVGFHPLYTTINQGFGHCSIWKGDFIFRHTSFSGD